MLRPDTDKRDRLKLMGEPGNYLFGRRLYPWLPFRPFSINFKFFKSSRGLDYAPRPRPIRPCSTRLFTGRPRPKQKVGPITDPEEKQIFRVATGPWLFHRSGRDPKNSTEGVPQLFNRSVCTEHNKKTHDQYKPLAEIQRYIHHRKHDIQDSLPRPDRQALLLPGTGLYDMENIPGDGTKISLSSSSKSRDGTEADRDLPDGLEKCRPGEQEGQSHRESPKKPEPYNTLKSGQSSREMEKSTATKVGILSVPHDFKEKTGETGPKKNSRGLAEQNIRSGRNPKSRWIQSWETEIWSRPLYSYQQRYSLSEPISRARKHRSDQKVPRAPGVRSEKSYRKTRQNGRSRTDGIEGKGSSGEPEGNRDRDQSDQATLRPPRGTPRPGCPGDNPLDSEYFDNILSLAEDLAREKIVSPYGEINPCYIYLEAKA